jgi:hypothetical protein
VWIAACDFGEPSNLHLNVHVDACAVTKLNRTESLLFTASMVFLASQGLFLLASPDLGHHLVVGEYTFHNGIPATNVFSPINDDYPLMQHEWAFQVLGYVVAAVAGVDALAWVRLVIVLAMGVILHRCLRPGRGYVAAVSCLALGLFVAHGRFLWRPELFSMLFLAVELKLLIDFVERRNDRLIFIPLIFVVWANFHGYFLAGLIVMGCFAVGELGDALRSDRDLGRARRLAGIGLLCTAATVVNPYHVEGAIYPVKALIDLFTVDSHFSVISELKPPSEFSHHWSVKAWYPLLVVFVASCAAQGRRVRLSYVLTALAIWLMARSTSRNIGLYGLTLGMLAAVQWQSATRWKSIPLLTARHSRWSAVATSMFLFAMAGFVGTNRLYVAEGELRVFGAGVDVGLEAPARDFIRDHIPADSQVFNSFALGSTYLWWFYPERLPFLDGNGGAYPSEFFAEYLSLARGKQRFDPFARRHGIDWVYLRLKTKLSRILYRSPHWHPVFLDGDAIILVNESPRFTDLRQRFDLRSSLAEGRIPDWNPTPLPTFLRKTFPQRELILLKFLRRVGEKRAADTVSLHVKKVLWENRQVSGHDASNHRPAEEPRSGSSNAGRLRTASSARADTPAPSLQN